MKLQTKILIVLLVFVALLGGVYAAGISYYKERLLPNTYINDVNYGSKTLFEIQNNLESDNEEYVISIVKNDGTTEEIYGSDFDYKHEVLEELEKIKANQNPVLWITAMMSESRFTVKSTISYDEKKLKEAIEKLNCLTSIAIKEPVNASVEVTSDGVKIIEEQHGNKLKKEDTIRVIMEAVAKNKEEVNLAQNDLYMKAEITTEHPSIQEVIQKVDKETNFTITYTFGSETAIIDQERIMSWLIYDENGTSSYNEDKMLQYVKNLASKYDTYGKKRQFVTTGGETVTLNSGILGWQMDVDKTFAQLKEAIYEREDNTLTPKYKLYCLTRENDDIGDTYIEVSIEKQHLWFYRDGIMIFESDVVTGLTNGKRDTPKGAFCVWSREKGRTLGQMDDEGYETWVDYWMPFDWTGCGLHDSNRSSFGGEIYKTKGSHGCVNCPKETAKFLYENISTGTHVLIY